MEDSEHDLPEALDRCFEVLLARHPTAQERAAVQNISSKEDLFLVCRAILNSNAFTFLE